MQRVAISASAFKLSKPGYDVANATADQLVFDAFANKAYNGVYIAGFFPASGLVNNGQFNTATIAFGKTFAAPPQVIVLPQEPGTKNGVQHNYYAYAARYNGSTGQVYYQQGVQLLVSVATDKLVLSIDKEFGNYNFNIGFLYAVMQF